jgi:hypothetical protein
MRLPAVLACMVVAATVLFVVGVALERSSEHHETTAGRSETAGGETAGGETAGDGEHAGEAGVAAESELRPLGIDVEAWPFVAIAAAASLALAAAAWLRPRARGLLGIVAAAFLTFAALDVREIVHQIDVDEPGLALLAGVVTALHVAAALVAGAMAAQSSRCGAEWARAG